MAMTSTHPGASVPKSGAAGPYRIYGLNPIRQVEVAGGRAEGWQPLKQVRGTVQSKFA